jgi:hypothetical protein
VGEVKANPTAVDKMCDYFERKFGGHDSLVGGRNVNWTRKINWLRGHDAKVVWPLNQTAMTGFTGFVRRDDRGTFASFWFSRRPRLSGASLTMTHQRHDHSRRFPKKTLCLPTGLLGVLAVMPQDAEIDSPPPAKFAIERLNEQAKEIG